MRPGYVAGWLAHIIRRAGHASVADVRMFAEVGAVGPAWPPHGVRVALASGDALYLAVVRASSDKGNSPDMPTEFVPPT